MTQLNKSINENNAIKLKTLRPLVDIYESDEGVVLMGDLPGVELEQLEIQVEGKVLSIEGKVAATNTQDSEVELDMIVQSVYQRSFSLSEGLDFTRIDAELKSGLLTINVPKKAAEAPQKITVRAA